MNRKFTFKRVGIAIAAMLLCWNVSAQTIIYSETFGTPSGNTAIGNYTGWSNSSVTYTGDGTCDVRTTNASIGYATASGSGNVMINNTTKWFQVSGINTAGYENLKLSFGLRKPSAGETGSNLKVEISNNGGAAVLFSVPALSGAAGWYYVTIEDIPASTNLAIKFSDLSSAEFRLDDLLLISDNGTVLSDNNNLASLTPSTGSLVPGFDADILSYSLLLPYGTTAIPTLNYTLADASASDVYVNATSVIGTASIQVTAEDGTKKTYLVKYNTAIPAETWIETFETETFKSSYTEGDYEGVATSWRIAGVATNNDVQDVKNMTASLRLRDKDHFIAMTKDKANGAGTISFYHGRYGTHGGGAYTLSVSTDQGETWDAYSTDVETVPAVPEKISFAVNIEGNIRIKITKTNSTGSTSINIDDIEITNFDPNINITPIANGFKVYATNNTIFVNGLNTPANISVYDITGKLIRQTASAEIPVATKGIFIVKVNGQAFKVINK